MTAYLENRGIIFCSGQAKLVSNVDGGQVGTRSSEGGLHFLVTVADGVHQSRVARPIHCVQLHSLHAQPTMTLRVLM